MPLRAPHQPPLFGRDGAREGIEGALAEGERLVSIVGTGGVGKTALAVAIAADAARLARIGIDGVSWCTAVPGSLEELVLAVALASGQRLGSDEPPAEALARSLVDHGGGGALLVLDECERSLAAVTRLVPLLLARVPALRILVTSRIRLDLAAEIVVELAPLDVPAAGSTGREAIARAPAVEVLLDRARRAAAPTAMLDEELPALAAIAQRVGGLPLALELCAARFSTLSPKQLLARLSEGTLGLSDKRRGARHQSLEAVIRASWELLDETQQRALAQCSVFTESFSLESAEAVLAPDPGGGAAVSACLEALRAQSMIGMRLPGPRFTLLEAVREFAAARLAESGTADRITGRHAAHFAASSGAIEADLPNLLSVVQRRTFPVEGRRAALAIAAILRPRGALVALAEVLGAALATPATEDVGALDAELSLTLGEVEMLRGRRAAAVERYDAAVARATGALRVRALIERADGLSRLGRFDDARRDLDEVARIDPSPERARALGRSRATLAWHVGTLEEQRREAARALADAIDAGDPARTCDARVQLAKGLIVAGALDEARASLDRARREAEAAGLGITCVAADFYLAICDLDGGRLDDARRGLGRAAEHAARADLRDVEAWSKIYLGATLRLLDANADAGAMLDEGCRALRSAGPLAATARYLAAFAGSDAASFELDAARADLAAQAFADVVRAHRAIREARRLAAGDPRGARETLAAARAAITAARDGAARFPPGYGFDVRLAARLLAAAADAVEAAHAGAAPPLKALTVGPEARWFRLEGGARASLERAPAVRRLLDALVQARLTAPERPLSVWDLWRAGWPDDKGSADAASNRVYVTLNRLRRLGLSQHIVRRDDGWMLDAGARVERA